MTDLGVTPLAIYHDSSKGNVHSNAPPPWLSEELEEDKDSGSTPTDASWMPKFGRVFNLGSRAHSLLEFRREQRQESAPIEQTASLNKFVEPQQEPIPAKMQPSPIKRPRRRI